MQALSFANLMRALSPTRLNPYRLQPSDSPRIIMGRYRWNWALASALQAPLSAFEIAFRNRVHVVMTRHYGRSDWFDAPSLHLRVRSRDEVNQVKDRRARRNKPCNPDDVVAALHLGFWCGLLDRDYEQVLFPQPLVQAFTGMPRTQRTRRRIYERLESLKELRNRISHHEPIWNDQALPKRHGELLETLSWFSPESVALLPVGPEHDFRIVFNRGPAYYEIDVT